MSAPPRNSARKAHMPVSGHMRVIDVLLFECQDKEGIKRLADLKHRIRKRAAESEKHNGRALNRSTLPYVECLREYENPSDFAELVYQDLQKCATSKKAVPIIDN